jgi:hypothetical protein
MIASMHTTSCNVRSLVKPHRMSMASTPAIVLTITALQYTTAVHVAHSTATSITVPGLHSLPL